ncbi:MAG: aminotransferase class V-fold PLP-dependent enzyme [Clostridia bacterium]|nr:aminotransferase class V-fold PLP-dependent enzyme [Clostridia bacterium]
MIYFDNAATSFPKPAGVLRETSRCIKNYCGNPGRGGHYMSRISAERVYETREIIADFFGSSYPENVIFTYNDTYALNMAIKGIVKKGDHVLISDMEHNSVYRPIASLKEKGVIEYDIFGTEPEFSDPSEKICDNIRRLIKRETRLLVCTHSPNICSGTLPVEEIGKICRDNGIIFILDAAQSAGHISVNMEKMNIDILCAPGHKGLYGLQGSGFMILGDNIKLLPFAEGGSGVNSLSPFMPEDPPERYEAGTLSLPAIVSLCEGIKFVQSVGVSDIHAHESELFLKLSDMLSCLRRVKVYSDDRLGSVLLFNIEGVPSERVAEALDRKRICVRSGFHCSPLGHNTLGTGENGAVRVSFGYFNTMRELDVFYSALKGILHDGI